MERWYYVYSGLNVASELQIPEWAPFEQSAPLGHADVLIALVHGRFDSTATPEGKSEQAETTTAPFISADEYRFCAAQIARYRIHLGREIVITPAPDAGEREVRLFLLGSAWGALCYQRGILALHSSVVEVGGRAVAFCGATGAGKSSLAAALIARGYRCVCDDLCRFEVFDGQARVYPAAPRLKLWRDTLERMGKTVDGLERDHIRMDKFHTTLDRSGVTSGPLALGALYLLEWGAPGIDRLTGLNALCHFISAATYRGELLEPMGQVAAHWERCAALAERVPVYQFSRPRDWSGFDTTAEMLIQHWQSVFDIEGKSR